MRRTSYELGMRGRLLKELGKEVQRRYKQNLRENNYGYNLKLIENGVQFESDIVEFDNLYFFDNGEEKLDKIAYYFEYGTGLYNSSGKGKPITPKNAEFLTWIGKNGKRLFAKEVRGVHPLFALMKAVKSVDHDRKTLLKKYAKRFGYD